MIVFVRHGQTGPNVDGRLLGRSDPPLTDVGRAQAERLAARLAAEQPVAVLTSPLRRAVTTAQIIAEAAGASVTIEDRLVELDYGDWDGRRVDELPAGSFDTWRDDVGFRPPGGESLGDVRARVVSLGTELFASGGPADRGVVVAVSHVSPIKAAVTWALQTTDDLAWRMHLSVASITRIGSRDGVPYLLSFNDTSHLDPL